MKGPGDRFNARLRWLALGSTALGLLVVGKAFSIQIMTDPRLEKLARRQFQSKVLMSPRRGSILDRNGEALAVNVETRSLAANPAKVRKNQALVRLLASALGTSASQLNQRLRTKREFLWLRRHLSEVQLNLLKKLQVIAPDGDLVEGLWLVRESKRVYPHHELAAHVLGNTNIDNAGLEGIELWKDSTLKGRVVSVETTKDALGRPTFLDAAVARSVKDGESVQLTLDASLQYAIQQELKRSVVKTGSQSGTVIVMNAVNGEILAMANEPSFDPNSKAGSVANRRNRAVTDGFEPGSTMKPVLLAAALSSGMKLQDRIWGERGSFSVQGKKISEAEADEKFEWTSLKKMISVSSNVVSAKLALKLGADRYSKFLSAMGFNARTGLGFPGEMAGRVPPRKSWHPLTLANIGFGQGLLVTPMQMVRAYAAFLNGGWLVDPVLVMDGDREDRRAPIRVFSSSVAGEVVGALESVTQQGGTGLKAALEGYRVAGKTGTAQTVDPSSRRYSRSRYISSFIGFATGVEPRLVIFTSLDGPRGIYYASETAAPLFRNVLSAVVNRFSIPSDSRLLVRKPLEETPLERSEEPGVSDVIEIVKAHPGPKVPNWELSDATAEWTMPSLIGLTAREALQVLQGRPNGVEMEGRGVVRSQKPDPGIQVAGRSTIRLRLSPP